MAAAAAAAVVVVVVVGLDARTGDGMVCGAELDFREELEGEESLATA